MKDVTGKFDKGSPRKSKTSEHGNDPDEGRRLQQETPRPFSSPQAAQSAPRSMIVNDLADISSAASQIVLLVDRLSSNDKSRYLKTFNSRAACFRFTPSPR